ncbi:unnamed protein product [Prorocentrum cordatum]|uniref:Uncharacterized protein n=1 Tax=Prorocentrum cordatum TaxID=2364126 RepID=A0ABN9W2G3_9DINO|nr:unnamed protein product [Polarella glacialis]
MQRRLRSACGQPRKRTSGMLQSGLWPWAIARCITSVTWTGATGGSGMQDRTRRVVDAGHRHGQEAVQRRFAGPLAQRRDEEGDHGRCQHEHAHHGPVQRRHLQGGEAELQDQGHRQEVAHGSAAGNWRPAAARCPCSCPAA